jgi:hypothetical protein
VGTLVFCSGRSAGRRQGKGRLDATLVAWDPKAARELRARGVAAKTPADYLGRSGLAALDSAALAWVKGFGRAPLLDGHNFRELAHSHGVSLWWFAELFLYESTRLPHFVRVIETAERILAAELPTEVEADGLPVLDEILLGRVCTTLGILFHGRLSVPRAMLDRQVSRVSAKSRWRSFGLTVAALAGRLRPAPRVRASPGVAAVLFLSHTARARRTGDGFDQLIPEIGATPGLRALHVTAEVRASPPRSKHEGPRPLALSRFARPSLLRPSLTATKQLRRFWRRFAESGGFQSALSHHDVRFGDLAAPDLAATLLLHLPWTVRALETVSELLRVARPALLCLDAEASVWGRVAVAACRAAGVRTLGLQQRPWEPRSLTCCRDEDEAECPRPDVTAVFGETTRRLLAERGHYAPAELAVVGSPRLDALAGDGHAGEALSTRVRLKVGPSDKLVVVASRFQAEREERPALGPVFAELVRSVSGLANVVCFVKPHPDESASPYQAIARQAGSSRVRVLSPRCDLTELLRAADALVTVECGSVYDALVLGNPVVIVNAPTRLAALVEQGVALGVNAGDDPLPALTAALTDRPTQERLAAERLRYVTDLAMGVDGHSLERLQELGRSTVQATVHATVGAP